MRRHYLAGPTPANRKAWLVGPLLCTEDGGDFIVLLWLTITLQRRVHTPLQGLCHALTMWLSGLLLPLTV